MPCLDKTLLPRRSAVTAPRQQRRARGVLVRSVFGGSAHNNPLKCRLVRVALRLYSVPIAKGSAATASVRLTDQENQALQELAQKTGKTQDELLHEAVTRFIGEVGIRRLTLVHNGRGIWKERADLPDPRALRAELDRVSS